MTEDFIAMQQQALRQLEQMQRQAKKGKPPDPPSKPPPEPKRNPTPANGPKPFSGLFSLLHLDRDALLILPLMLLLIREGADDALLLALIYIML